MRISAEEEQDLFLRWKCGGELAARRRIVEGHLWLVRLSARHYRSRISDRPDLIAEGSIALLLAVERFDERRGVRFATYARQWVKAAMSAYLLRTTNATGSLARARMTSRLRRDPAVDAPSCARDLSLDAPIAGVSWTLLDTLASSLPDPEETTAQRRWRETAKAALEATLGTLDDRERAIFAARFHADEEDDSRLHEVASELGLSKERVRQLEGRLRRKLMSLLREAAASMPGSVG